MYIYIFTWLMWFLTSLQKSSSLPMASRYLNQKKRLQAVCKLRPFWNFGEGLRRWSILLFGVWTLYWWNFIGSHWRPLCCRLGRVCSCCLGRLETPWKEQPVYTWKWMVGTRSFPFGAFKAHFQGRLLLVSGRVDDFLDSSESFSVPSLKLT